jgi:NAD(P)-dependent dehydrogenase (short-subunit alcohol dehydrogenase family)
MSERSTVPIKGKVCLVTGASSGIGEATAAGLARRGARVVMVCRDREKGEQVRSKIVAMSGNESVDLLIADLSSQSSIRELAEEFKRKYDSLQELVNCAAVWKSARFVSPDGLELMFATNHLGYFLLTNLLLDVLNGSAPSGVFNVTAPSTVKLDFADLQGERRFSPVRAFGASKAANLLFTFALARRLTGSGVVANAYHPGVARSNLMREAPAPMRLFGRVLALFAGTPEQAAKGLVQLVAGNAGGANGKFFHGRKLMTAPAYTRDREVQERLWTESVRLSNLG